VSGVPARLRHELDRLGGHRLSEVAILNAAMNIMQAPDRALERRHAHQDIMKPEGLYLRRWFLSGGRDSPLKAFLHEIRLSDTDPDPHDHPWDYTSIVLAGGYDEETEHGVSIARPGEVVRRMAEHTHRVRLVDPTWTLFIAGSRRRAWGFKTREGWQDYETYLRARGRWSE
jgi:hypothetical protein